MNTILLYVCHVTFAWDSVNCEWWIVCVLKAITPKTYSPCTWSSGTRVPPTWSFHDIYSFNAYSFNALHSYCANSLFCCKWLFGGNQLWDNKQKDTFIKIRSCSNTIWIKCHFCSKLIVWFFYVNVIALYNWYLQKCKFIDFIWKSYMTTCCLFIIS